MQPAQRYLANCLSARFFTHRFCQLLLRPNSQIGKRPTRIQTQPTWVRCKRIKSVSQGTVPVVPAHVMYMLCKRRGSKECVDTALKVWPTQPYIQQRRQRSCFSQLRQWTRKGLCTPSARKTILHLGRWHTTRQVADYYSNEQWVSLLNKVDQCCSGRTYYARRRAEGNIYLAKHWLKTMPLTACNSAGQGSK